MAAQINNVSELKGGFPTAELKPIAEDEVGGIGRSAFKMIKAVLTARTASSFEDLFFPDAFWRDQVALTWSLRTFHPLSKIQEAIPPLLLRAGISDVELVEDQVALVNLPTGFQYIRVPIKFTTSAPEAACTAAFKVIQLASAELKVFTVTSNLVSLAATPWIELDTTPKEAVKEPALPQFVDLLVVGGGHAGLSISAYLKALGINFAMIDRQERIGDSWAKRYDSATLHTTKLFSGLPFIPFPDDYPLYVRARDIALYYQQYAATLELPTFMSCRCTSAMWDECQRTWKVTLEGSHGIEHVRARSLVFAIGIGGREPIVPDVAGKGKRVAVIGASTTACNVPCDAARAGADITMIQRGGVRIYPAKDIAFVQKLFWNKDQPIEVGDTMSTEDPVALQAVLSNHVLAMLKRSDDPAYYERLAKTGFKAITEGPIHQQIFCLGGKHYPDVGFVDTCIRGEIKVKSDSLLTGFTSTGLQFADGTTLEDVDVVVFCTGFEKDNRVQIASIVGTEHTEKMEPVWWGLDSEGEVPGVWRPTGHDNIWIQGGELQSMRYYGRMLALQLAADLAGVRPVPVRA